MATTIDHISGGRYGMNLVMGWFTPEMELFGRQQLPHDERYEYGQEWIDFVEKLWTQHGDFDVEGKHFDVQGRPRLPQAGPDAAGGAAQRRRVARPGSEFSARNVDINLIALPIEETPRVREEHQDAWRSDKYERDIDVWTYCLVICRETEKEARAAHQAIIDAGDWPGAQIIMDVLGIESASFGTQIKQFQERFIAGWGGPNLIGTPAAGRRAVRRVLRGGPGRSDLRVPRLRQGAQGVRRRGNADHAQGGPAPLTSGDRVWTGRATSAARGRPAHLVRHECV